MLSPCDQTTGNAGAIERQDKHYSSSLTTTRSVFSAGLAPGVIPHAAFESRAQGVDHALGASRRRARCYAVVAGIVPVQI